MVDGSPEVVSLTIDLHEHLAEMPPPSARSHALDAAFLDLGREHRPEPVLPVSTRLVADIYAPLV